jgi:hypothetical protein
MIISRSIFHGIRSVSEKKSCREVQNTLCAYVFPENRAVYKTMWKNVVEPKKPQTTILYGACDIHGG